METSSFPRPIYEILDMPYSELTEEEIDAVIEFKATMKAKSEEHEQRKKALDYALAQIIKNSEEMAAEARRNFELALKVKPDLKRMYFDTEVTDG